MNNKNNNQFLVHNEQWTTIKMHNELQWQCTNNNKKHNNDTKWLQWAMHQMDYNNNAQWQQ